MAQLCLIEMKHLILNLYIHNGFLHLTHLYVCFYFLMFFLFFLFLKGVYERTFFLVVEKDFFFLSANDDILILIAFICCIINNVYFYFLLSLFSSTWIISVYFVILKIICKINSAWWKGRARLIDGASFLSKQALHFHRTDSISFNISRRSR